MLSSNAAGAFRCSVNFVFELHVKFAAADSIVNGRLDCSQKTKKIQGKTVPGEGFPLWLAPEGVLVFPSERDWNYLKILFVKKNIFIDTLRMYKDI